MATSSDPPVGRTPAAAASVPAPSPPRAGSTQDNQPGRARGVPSSLSDVFAADDRVGPRPRAAQEGRRSGDKDGEPGTSRTMPGPAARQRSRTSGERQPPSRAGPFAGPAPQLPAVVQQQRALAPPTAPFLCSSASSSTLAPYSGVTLPPSPASSTSAGVQLVEDISPDAAVLQRGAGRQRQLLKDPQTSADAARSQRKGSISRAQMGTVRTMSQRGKKPTRVIKRRVINKIDAKSYFSNERTSYSWMMIGSISLGIGLNLYGYISIDRDLATIGLQVGTVLSTLALLVFFYATYHFLWRRRALSCGMGATAFDDRIGPWFVTLVLVVGLLLNIGLAWRSPVGFDVRVHHRSFTVKDRGSLDLHQARPYNPYKKNARQRNGTGNRSGSLLA